MSRFRDLQRVPERKNGGQPDALLPEDFIRRLGSMGADDFRASTDRQAIQQLWATGQKSHLQRVIGTLVSGWMRRFLRPRGG